MIKSMTAFGRAKIEGAEKDITVEIKSLGKKGRKKQAKTASTEV